MLANLQNFILRFRNIAFLLINRENFSIIEVEELAKIT
jgi:hypothetical protein